MTTHLSPKMPPKDFLTGPLTGHMVQMMRNRYKFLQNAMLNQGDFVHFKYLRASTYLVLHPEGIKHVLQSKNLKYSKMVRGSQFLARIGGRGLLTSEGEFWQKSRRVIQPFFIKKQYGRYVELMQECAENLGKRWQEFGDKEFDLSPEMTKFTLNVLGRSIFNEDFDSYTDVVFEELRNLLNITEDRIIHLIPRMGKSKRIQDEEFNRSLKRLEDLVDELILKAKETSLKEPDKNFIHALLESDADFSDKDLRDHIISLMIAGHETTATALCWLMILLEKHPEVKGKVLTEVKEKIITPDLTLEMIQGLEYSTMVANETLRLYPPFWVMGRVAVEDDELLGHKIKKGDRIQINPYFTHHNPRYWERPEEFIPERFSPENLSKINEFCFLPFGKGPRTCIGNHFAMFEILVALAVLYNKLEVSIVNAGEIKPDFRITLRPDREVRTRVRPL